MPFKIMAINTTHVASRLRRPIQNIKPFRADKLNCYTIIDLSTGKVSKVGGACNRVRFFRQD